ncbi:enolase C-terminal domain-like protein [Botrimarina sp.]|uniref:enolase C-terminal domain-like protein n=1 Tax=Botrimarina sp. TaxID=2795802 RepID=UPI0032EE6BC6
MTPPPPEPPGKTLDARRRPQRALRGASGRAAAHDARPVGAEVYFLPVATRVPLKFGAETLTSVTCARARVTVADRHGRTASGWGETPLSVQWLWPSPLPYAERHDALQAFCLRLAERWAGFAREGHPLEIGHAFQTDVLPSALREFNARRAGAEPMPLLAALACCSPLDIATYDAYGQLHETPVFEAFDDRFLAIDLGEYLTPEPGSGVDFRGQRPSDYLARPRPDTLVAWHLVGGLDPLDRGELTGDEPDDGRPVVLGDWIARDGLKCLKIKLRGTDAAWDYRRLVRIGEIAAAAGVEALTADFNCTVTDPRYVVDILDRLRRERPAIYEDVLYIEQPFPYDLEANQIDVHEVSRRKLLLMDESAHNWRLVRLGKSLGWTGVALKTCKTLTGAVLSLCWAKAHGMGVMVQDLTNPMLAQIPHVLLAAHSDTLMGVETNASQFYPDASADEARVHPGLYERRGGVVDLGTLRGPGFGYRVAEIGRELPPCAGSYGAPPDQ